MPAHAFVCGMHGAAYAFGIQPVSSDSENIQSFMVSALLSSNEKCSGRLFRMASRMLHRPPPSQLCACALSTSTTLAFFEISSVGKSSTGLKISDHALTSFGVRTSRLCCGSVEIADCALSGTWYAKPLKYRLHCIRNVINKLGTEYAGIELPDLLFKRCS